VCVCVCVCFVQVYAALNGKRINSNRYLARYRVIKSKEMGNIQSITSLRCRCVYAASVNTNHQSTRHKIINRSQKHETAALILGYE
jgi:hypothetical protein